MRVQSNTSRIIRRLLISAAALSVAASVASPALAGGRGHGGRYYEPRHYDYGYYPRYRNHGHYYNGGRHRGRISAGEGALIAAGIIGGVILIDRALDDRDRRYDDRYRYEDRYRRGAFDDDYYYQRDNRPYDDWRYGDRFSDRRDDDQFRSASADRDIDDLLLGEKDLGGRAIPADVAFRECVAETRGAAGAGGMTVAMPAVPDRVEELADGSVRMSASFRAANPRGESWTRRFVCEADAGGVRFLQVD